MDLVAQRHTSQMMATKALLQTLVFGLVLMMFATHHAWGEHDCYREKIILMQYCKKTISKFTRDYKQPTQNCKDLVKIVDMTCVCSVFTSEDETQIDVRKFLYLAHQCGKPVTPGTICASK